MRTSQVRPALAMAAAAAALVAGCGSSHPPSPAPSAQATHNFAGDAYRYSACMRNHGVTNFPDPKVSTHNGGVSVIIAAGGVDFNSPQAKSAQNACQGLMPAAAAAGPTRDQPGRTQALLAFARCMRAGGVQRFPDPTSNGQLNLSMINSAGVDLHAPTTLTAGLACARVTHGIITRADVEQAISRNQQ
jgi:hypothetical protein